MKLNYRSLLAAVITASLAVPGAAMADKRGHGARDYGYKSGRHQSYKYDRHHYRGNAGRHYSYGQSHHDDDDDLLIGLVVGGVLGYALNSAQHNSAGYDSYYPRAQRNAYPVMETETYSYSAASCLQEREYTTTVKVGGRNVEAYGTACLQPDGSWRRGPAEVASY